ncbi:hypothetical protein GCM10020360_25880 [Nonlabens tegetincola]
MGNSNQAVNNIRNMISTNGRTYAWLSRQTGVPYKRLLAEVKNGTRPISLETALAATEALDAGLPDLLGSNA